MMQTVTIPAHRLKAFYPGIPEIPAEYSFALSLAERKVMAKPVRVPPSKWAPKERVITYGPFKGQYWRSDLTPYLDGVMDAAMFPSVQEFYLVKGVQTGGSEAVHTCVGWSAEFMKVPVMYIFPDMALARENSQERILTMIERSPALAKYLSGADDDKTNFRIRLIHLPIYIGWASSAAQLSNKPIGLAVADETEIYKEEVSEKHADAISELKDRLTTYLRLGLGKLIALSTPTTKTGPIMAGYNAASVRFELFVPCPACGHIQTLRFSGLTWPRIHKKTGKLRYIDPKADDDAKKDFIHPPASRILEEKLGRYRCTACADLWDDARRNEAVAKGKWRESLPADPSAPDAPVPGKPLMKVLRSRRPASVGMKLPSFFSWFFSLSTGAAAWTEYLASRDRRKRKHFFNKYCAEPYTEYARVRAEDKILSLRDDRPSGLVPGGGVVSGLVAGIDTQDNGFWYWIHAFGYGLTEESWEIRSGWQDTFDGVRRVLLEDAYTDPDGNRYLVQWAVQDAMGHRTADVYDFCRVHRGRIVPFKGEPRMAAPTAWSKVDTYPGTAKPIPGGIKLLRANVNHYKDKVSGKLDIAPADPGALHLTADFDEDKAAHLCAETIDEKTGMWINPHGRANHLWDCLVLCFVAADVLGLRFRSRPETKDTAPDRSVQKPDPPPAGHWLPPTQGWVRRW